MKKTVVMAAVTAMLGVAVLSGPALAQNRSNIVTQTTADSAFFGFVPSAANLNTFMQKDPSSGANGTNTAYIKNNQMPGSYTDRPDTGGNSLRTVANVVSAVPDFGCGVWTDGVVPLTSTGLCDESTINLHDRVNGNVTGGDAVNSGLGQNTAPTAQVQGCGAGGNGQVCGTLVGDMTSNVTIAQAADDTDGMPTGYIRFTRGDLGVSSFDQLITQSVTSNGTDPMYDFSEHDRTEDGLGNPATFVALIPQGTNVVNGGGFCSGFISALPCNDAAGRTSGGGATLPSYAATGLPIKATLSLTQTAMGGDGVGSDSIGYTVNFPGNGTYPTTGSFFTPGLNVADWVNSPAVDNNGFPN